MKTTKLTKKKKRKKKKLVYSIPLRFLGSYFKYYGSLKIRFLARLFPLHAGFLKNQKAILFGKEATNALN